MNNNETLPQVPSRHGRRLSDYRRQARTDSGFVDQIHLMDQDIIQTYELGTGALSVLASMPSCSADVPTNNLSSEHHSPDLFLGGRSYECEQRSNTFEGNTPSTHQSFQHEHTLHPGGQDIQNQFLARGHCNRRLSDYRRHARAHAGLADCIDMSRDHITQNCGLAITSSVINEPRYVAANITIEDGQALAHSTYGLQESLINIRCGPLSLDLCEPSTTSSSSQERFLQSPYNCSYCSAKKFFYECDTFCCSRGEIKLAPQDTPDEMKYLFTSTDKDASYFRKYIRGYNSAFSFTSFGVSPKQDLEPAGGTYCFKLHGQLYHQIHHLIPTGDHPKFLQLYIYDTDNEIANRLHHLPHNLRPPIMTYVTQVLNHCNPFVATLRMLKDMPNFGECGISINQDITLDQRTYNSPTASQVAAIWVEGSNPQGTQERVVMLQPRQGPCSYISSFRGCYDPMQYPLMFPRGEPGWQCDVSRHRNDRSRKDRRVSVREYYAYKLQIRVDDPSILLYAGRLLHQYLVDMYVKIESDRLNYFYRNQQKIKAELYSGLGDSIIDGHTSTSSVGRTILPATFIGGMRDVQARYRDAMAIVQFYGKPDLFITMTCNPKWVEIQNELCPGQQPNDRPDLCARVFYNKLRDFIHVVIKKRFFGQVIAYAIVVEFQKRGLPHAHVLLILGDGKPRNPDDYDRLVCAEIPDHTLDTELHKRVTSHMMHGPCGPGTRSPCMVEGRCRFHYPRSFCPATTHGVDSYPIYRRRNNGKIVYKKDIPLDNTWVVPYNPELLLMFNCHLNVEICSSVLSVKYLYKYIYKGHDRVQFTVDPNAYRVEPDEIKRYQNARWISAIESAWRIFRFDLFFMFPAVYNLPIHLPDNQLIHFSGDQNIVDVLANDRNQVTMLTAFFLMNETGQVHEALLYKDFPRCYVWHNDSKIWTKRKKSIVIGRTYTVSPKEGERYYLRILLNHVKGPISFNNLRTVDGILYTTFREACIRKGLLEDDGVAIQCLLEAESYQMPSGLRQLFAIILVFCEPNDVQELWAKFWRSMAADYFNQGTHVDHVLESMLLRDLDDRLRQNQKSISDYDLPQISVDVDDFPYVPHLMREALNVNTPADDFFCISNLNTEQQEAYTLIVQALQEKMEHVFFIDGPGGFGKTFLYRALLAYVRVVLSRIAVATASSGIAAMDMPGGRTAHSRFNIPINLNELSTCTISKQSALALLLKSVDLFIWDEAPMMTKYAFEALDRTMQDIMDTNKLFGGKIFVLGGDFRQILPVIPKGTRGQIVESCLVSSYLWPLMTKLKLTVNMRAVLDPAYSSFILQIGNGLHPTINGDLIRIPSQMLVPDAPGINGKITLINEIFAGVEIHGKDHGWLIERAILASKNIDVDDINQTILSYFPGEDVVYYSYDSVENDPYNLYSEDFLHGLNPAGFPLHELRLKEDCTVLLLRNLNPSMGLCNGTRLICKNFSRNVICAVIISGQYSGHVTFIPRIPMLPTEGANIPITFKRKQFPVKLAFAMTINKSQGQTIPTVGIYLPDPVFAHGQLYVALSRGICRQRTKIYIKGGKIQGNYGVYTRNIVYNEVLT